MNILISSVGRRTYMVDYFRQALSGKGKVFASNSVLTFALKQADEYVITPEIYEIDYIPFLLNYCEKNSINAVISLFDIDLPILAMNKELFNSKGIRVIVSDYDVTTTCGDKWKTYKFLTDIGVNQPTSFLSLSAAKQAIICGKVNFPLFVKPRWGMGSIGVYRVETVAELDVFYKKLQREIFTTYLKYESAIEENASIIIQQAIIGQEYGVEVLNDLQGNYIATFAKKKLAMRSGETDVAQTVDPIEFEDIGTTISRQLKHIANLDMDCIISEDGVKYVIEMNCRFGGQYPFTHNAGVNIPKQIVMWLEGQDTDKKLICQKVGITSCKDLRPVIL